VKQMTWNREKECWDVTMHYYCAECSIRCGQGLKEATAKIYAGLSRERCSLCNKSQCHLYGYKESLTVKTTTLSIRGVLAVAGSRRKCNLTPGCQGTMHAAVREYASGERSLWWHCQACRNELKSLPKLAIHAPIFETLRREEEETERIARELSSGASPRATGELEEVAARVRAYAEGWNEG